MPLNKEIESSKHLSMFQLWNKSQLDIHFIWLEKKRKKFDSAELIDKSNCQVKL